MNPSRATKLTLFALCTLCAVCAAVDPRPNIIFILSDDLGYGDITVAPGVNRTTVIPTPNIAQMASEGLQFVRGYSGPVCAPSRCTLMSGRHLGHCTIRGNDGAYSPFQSSDVLVSRVLKDAGYHTGLVGKWGLGNFGSTGYPLAMGFDEFIGQDSQVACHNWYPYLIQNNTLDNYTLPKNQHASEATCGPNRTKCTWSNDYFSDRANEFVTRAARGTKPFFLYFSTTTPHAGDLAGAHSENPTPAPYNQRFTEWGQQQDDFASAVSAMDDFVGRIMSTLKANNIYENTLVFFSGDNGPDSHALNLFDDPGPFRGKKRSLHEGGVRQDIIAQWPAKIKPGRTSDLLFTFWDFLPTAADAAGIPKAQWPATDGVSALATLEGNDDQQVKHDFLYWEFCYMGNASGTLPQLYPKGWGQSVRYDDGPTQWKAIRVDNGPMLLFNLTADIGEFHNISSEHPDTVDEIVKMMEQSHEDSKFWPSPKGQQHHQCCPSCFKPQGCSPPCFSPPSPPAPPPSPVPLRELTGEWRDGSKVNRYNMSVDQGAATVVLSVVTCPKCRWQTAKGTVSADGLSIKAEAMGPSGFSLDQQGSVEATGSELHISWANKWASWERSEGFDYD